MQQLSRSHNELKHLSLTLFLGNVWGGKIQTKLIKSVWKAIEVAENPIIQSVCEKEKKRSYRHHSRDTFLVSIVSKLIILILCLYW